LGTHRLWKFLLHTLKEHFFKISIIKKIEIKRPTFTSETLF